MCSSDNYSIQVKGTVQDVVAVFQSSCYSRGIRESSRRAVSGRWLWSNGGRHAISRFSTNVLLVHNGLSWSLLKAYLGPVNVFSRMTEEFCGCTACQFCRQESGRVYKVVRIQYLLHWSD